MFTDVDGSAVELRHALAADPARLDLVALAIARLDDAPFDDDQVLATLDRWAGEVDDAAGGQPAGYVESLTAVLGGRLGLRGDDEHYDAPANSFLPRVLERRRGLPILLSLVYLEVARRLDAPLFGLALPGHFVVGHRVEVERLAVLDPFAGGRPMTAPELAQLVGRAGATVAPAMFAPASAHTIATRMLRNLIGSYQNRARGDKVRAAAALMRAIAPDDGDAGRIKTAPPPLADDDLN